MKNNCCNRARIFALLPVAVALVAVLWPATGDGQTSSRRDRSRRDTSARFSSSRTDQASRQASEQKGQATKPAEPNAATARPAEAAPPVERPRAQASGMGAKYDIILQRNVFSRQRSPFRPRDSSQSQAVVVPNPETHFLLNGIVQENEQFSAFIEDTQGGGVLRLRQGDRVARGTIKTLSLDALEYQLEDKTIIVKLGCDLEGTRGATPVAVMATELPKPSQTPAPTTAPASASTSAGQQVQTQPQTAAPSGDEAAILKRLMEQRRQQLGQ
jgi:hypothetical protein